MALFQIKIKEMKGIGIIIIMSICTTIHSFGQQKPPEIISAANAAEPPSDAVVLFNGKDFSEWRKRDGNPPEWKLEDGVMTVIKGKSDILTKRDFGDIQLHLEWRAPKERKGEGQRRGNSGIFLQDRYEVQILDCWNNETYYVGQAGAIYNQYPPMVNPCRPSGEWQVYDIVYKAPKFSPSDQSLLEEARISVFMNGVLIQDNVVIMGRTDTEKPFYEYHLKKPIRLQDHNDGIEPSVSFRNIWVRELK
jgi:hypothetical protein